MIETLLRIILHVFWIFPIKNKDVVLTSFNGRLYSCNPKYLAEGLNKTGEFNIYFAFRKNIDVKLPDGIKPLRYKSLIHFYRLMTSRYIVVNSAGLMHWLPYRKSQVFINTWHGAGSFKATGVKAFTSKKDVRKRKISGENTTFFLSSSKQFTEDQYESMLVDKDKFLPTGLPRNDIFFEYHPDIIEKVKSYFNIDASKKIILYAPTYRDGPLKSITGYGFTPMDVTGVIDACNKRFNCEYVFLFKAHHDMLDENLNNACINASNYPDTQELLYAADLLISDYSSIQWDFALQEKPGFLYSPDVETYMHIHPFATDYHEWPYTTAQSNEELINQIQTYDEKVGVERIREYFKKMGSYEAGHAIERTLRQAFGLTNIKHG